MMKKDKDDNKLKNSRLKSKLKKDKDKVDGWRNGKASAMQEEEDAVRAEQDEAKANQDKGRKDFLKKEKASYQVKFDEKKQKNADEQTKQITEAERVKEERVKREA